MCYNLLYLFVFLSQKSMEVLTNFSDYFWIVKCKCDYDGLTMVSFPWKGKGKILCINKKRVTYSVIDYFFWRLFHFGFFFTKYVDEHFNFPFSTCVTWHCRLRWSQKSSLCSSVEQILNSRLSIHPSNQFRLVGADWGLSQLSEEEEDGWMDKYNCYSVTLPQLL